MNKKILFVLTTAAVIFTSVAPVQAFDTGWWIDREQTTASTLTTYGAQKQSLVLLAGWFVSTSQITSTKAYLDTAKAAGMKVIVGLEGGPTPTMSMTDFETVVNALKGHTAVWGWYIGDEPELNSSFTTIQTRHAKIKTYYDKLKQLDPNRPVMISFNQPYDNASWDQWKYQAEFYDSTDVIGIHAYPFWTTGGEFGTTEGRHVYDVWKKGLGIAKSKGKDFIATMQGFGAGNTEPYKTPTYDELRYETFSAMALGIDKVLFWIDSWGVKSNMTAMVDKQVSQIQEIGAQMKAGITNDPRITVKHGTSAFDPEKIVYRYGEADGKRILLAVNIANRGNIGANVPATFTFPGEGNKKITVLGENRTLDMLNDSFTDTFAPFRTHIYQLPYGGGTMPSVVPTQEMPTSPAPDFITPLPTQEQPTSPAPSFAVTPTPIPNVALYEAERSTNILGGTAKVLGCRSNCSGGSRVGYIGKGADNTLAFTDIYMEAAGGNTPVEIRYTNGYYRELDSYIEVNGSNRTNFQFKPTGGFGLVSSKLVTLPLAAGLNKITFGHESAYAPDIDAIVVYGTSGKVPGDANKDNRVDELDYIMWVKHYNDTTEEGTGWGDFDGDGVVDELDYVIWLGIYDGLTVQHIDEPLPSPEPTVAPTTKPTVVPTVIPSTVPTLVPTVVPTAVPTAIPTAKPSPTNVPVQAFNFISWSDTQGGTDILTTLSKQAKVLNPNFTIFNGDLCPGGFISSCASGWKTALNGGVNNGLADITFPVRGNHDYGDDTYWKQFFNTSTVAQKVGATNLVTLKEDQSYSFDFRGSRFIGLDAPGCSYTLSDAQTNWVDGRLSDAVSKGIKNAFLFFHGPVYYVDGHNECYLPDNMVSVIKKYNIVKASFHGHEHIKTYTWFSQNNSRIPGMTHNYYQIVSGGAGGNSYECNSSRSDYCNNYQGFVNVKVNGEDITVDYHRQGSSTVVKTMTFIR